MGSDEFQRAIEARDPEAVQATLAPDVVFRSPAVHRPYEGRERTAAVLAAVLEVVEDLRYTDRVEGADRTILFFEGRVGDRMLEGIDALRFGDDGRISELVVMVRPFSGLQALAEAVGARLPS